MIIMVTGTTSGLGRVTAEAIAAAGHQLIMACRDPIRAESVRREIAGRTGNEQITVVRCDLASLASVRACAAEVGDRWDRLDVLINNAGTMTTRFQTSADGLELTFAANYLGPWLLTRLLADRLLRSPGARIVNVASAVHHRGMLDLEALASETGKHYSGMRAYARSKLGNVMATLSLAERLAGNGLTANCLHPGVVATNIVSDTNTLLRIGMKLFGPLFLDPERGAKTTLHLALGTEVGNVSGAYFDERQRQQEPSASARDRSARDDLWAWSSRFCGVPETPVPVTQ
ncbi:MAG TPA: SDR family oxidoreductase [Pseudomonadales bacterium]